MSRSDTARAARAELEAVASGLGAEELLVLRYIAGRLAEGQERYGRLDLARDRRDLEAERAAEVADLLVYSAMAELRRVLVARASSAPEGR